jgi:tRNA pseudouridine38-40 synthase
VPSLRAALWLWYRGTRFRGWQRQIHGPTVQEAIEGALLAQGCPGGLAAAGRTDRGVHARQQVSSVRLPRGTEVGRLAETLQGSDWGCAAACAAPEGFHAQWTPSTKEYRYRLALDTPPAHWAPYTWDVGADPALAGTLPVPETMAEALALAAGTRDFFAFHAASSVRRLRTLARVECLPSREGLWELRFLGDGFGRYQVRALVGGAALVASGRLSWDSWRAALQQAVPFHGLLAPGHGLTLWAIEYVGPQPFARAPRRLPSGPPFEPAA